MKDAIVKLNNESLPEGSRFLILTQGILTVVDEDDFNKLSEFLWYPIWSKSTKSFYVYGYKRGSDEFVQMHRIVVGLKRGDKRQVDHDNYDTLDNRKSNLFITDCRGNQEKRRDRSKYGTGIRKRGNKFQLRVRCGGQRINVSFATLNEATKARELIVQELRNGGDLRYPA